MTPTRVVDDALFGSMLLVIALVVVFLLLPLIVTITMAFDARTYLGPFPPSEFSWRWFKQFFGDEYYMNGLKTSVMVAATSTIISTAVGMTAATALAEGNLRFKQTLQALFLSPLVVPSVVTGFALLLFFARIGLFGGFLMLCAGHVIITLPYTIRVSLAGLLGVPKSVKEAALVLGANEWRAFWTVSLPLAKSSVLAAGLFAFVFSMDDVAVSLFLSSVNTYTLPVAMVSMMRSHFDLSIAAAAVVLMLVMVALMMCVDRILGVNKIITGS
jgi:putative spermidine/putrescine transport system permease protein